MAERKRDTSKKRNSILDAAIKAFQEEGYDNTSMDRIAEIACASKRTVYNHFASKEALFQSVLDRFMDEFSTLKQIPYDPARSLESQLSDFAQIKISLMENPSWRGLMKVVLAVFIRDPALAKKTMAQAEAGEDSFIIWLNAAAADRKLQFKEAELVANVFWSMVGGAFFWPQLLQGPMDPATIQELKDELIGMFLCRYGTKLL